MVNMWMLCKSILVFSSMCEAKLTNKKCFFLAKQEQAEQGEAKQAEGRSLYRRGEDDDDVHGQH